MFRLAADRMMDDNGAPSAAKRTGNRVTKALVQAVYVCEHDGIDVCCTVYV